MFSVRCSSSPVVGRCWLRFCVYVVRLWCASIPLVVWPDFFKGLEGRGFGFLCVRV